MSNLFPGSSVLRVRRPSLLVAALALLSASLIQPARAEARVLPMCLGKQATIIGSSKANTLKGTKKADVIVGLGGNDRIIGGGGGDRICGGTGADRLFGGVGNDRMNGGKGTDQCLQEVGTGTKKSCEGPTFPLTVSKAGTGTGVVTSSPQAIDCGQTCLGQLTEGQKVTLTASAASPDTFDGWGGACTGVSSCTVVMSVAKAVTATFSKAPSSGGTPPLAPGPGPSCPAGPCYVVSRTGNTYRGVAPLTGRTLQGSLKVVVEGAVADLDELPSGDVFFGADVFDLGSDRFSLHDVNHIEFAGAGMDATTIQNSSDDPKDSEPFDMHDTNHIIIRDLTVRAGGSLESSSDAIDFDGGNDVIVERVKIAQSRGRGIVFDGKDAPGGRPRTADRNIIRNCVITGIPRHGIELLAASSNRVEGCTITDVGGHGIHINKAAESAGQPHKDSDMNTLVGNVIERVAFDGIGILAGDSNVIDGNIARNNSRDGIRIDSDSMNVFDCNDNIVRNNRSTDNNWYGLNIDSPACQRTKVEPNNVFSGNRRGNVRDVGMNTIKPGG
jgi:parallel beta-helix repeat protein